MDMPPDFELFLSRLALHCPFVLLLDLKRVPSKLKATGVILRQQPSKLNPCPSLCYLHVLTKAQGKGKWALPKKMLPRLWTTIWQRKDVWKTLFQNKPSGTINPVYLPRKLLNNTKNVSINKTLSITTLAQYFYPATLEEHPINNYDPDRVLFGNHAMERKCINSYTLDLGVR